MPQTLNNINETLFTETSDSFPELKEPLFPRSGDGGAKRRCTNRTCWYGFGFALVLILVITIVILAVSQFGQKSPQVTAVDKKDDFPKLKVESCSGKFSSGSTCNDLYRKIHNYMNFNKFDLKRINDGFGNKFEK